MRPIAALSKHLRDFGPAAASTKASLLTEIASLPRCSARELVQLQRQLGYLLAYPDDARVRRLAETVSGELARWVAALVDADKGHLLEDSGLPGTTSRRPFSYGMTRQLLRLVPGEVEVDWEWLEERAELHDTLGVLVSVGESPALDDIEIGTRAWLMARAREGDPARTGLEVLLDVFEQSGSSPAVCAALYEACGVPLRVDDRQGGRGRTELRFPVARVYPAKQQARRETWKLPPRIRAELTGVERLTPAVARRELDLGLLAMESRALEIYPMTHAEERDVHRIACGRGVEILLAGVCPAQRCAFEGLYSYLVTKNGVGIAYGPASPFLGSCELGINFFEEFRGAETRFLIAQVMRVLYQLLGVRNFYCTPYAMGRANPAALATGAFWFYRKLGFKTLNPDVEQLALSEEAERLRDPGHRSSRRTLLQLAETAAVLDLSEGTCPRFDSSALALAVTRDFQQSGLATRPAYEARRARSLARWLGIEGLQSWSAGERTSLERMAPALSLLPGLSEWSQRDRQGLVRIVRAKAASSEVRAAELMLAHRRLARGLRALCAGCASGAAPGPSAP